MAQGENKRALWLYLVFPLVLGAALALGSYSYRYALVVAQTSERSLVESNQLLGDQTLERIDNFIIDSDHSLFDLVDLEHLSDFARRWGEIVRLSPAIEAALVLDEHLEIMPGGYVSKKKGPEAEAFRELFMSKILPDLPLETLKPDLHKHMHRAYDGRDYLVSFIRRERQGRTFHLVLKVSLEYLVRTFFPTQLAPLKGKVQFCIRDDQGRVVFGESLGQPGKFLYERAFPTTLYLWRLQMAPTETARLVIEERARRRTEVLLISLMLGTVLVGVGVLLYAMWKERRANELKSDFISNVSHELKTPLSLIRMFGELLALGKVKTPEKAKEYAEIITRESERLARLIDNVLDFSRMERGKAAYEFQMGRLDAVCERALDVYRYRIEQSGMKLTTKIDSDVPETMLDENAMTLLLLNLLENAVKYGKNEVSVYVGVVGKNLRLVVGDQGPGIAPDEQKKIFDRFYRTKDARGTNVRGSGIGLSLVKHIAEAHGGEVSLDSELGRGANFIVDLPLTAQKAAA